MSDRALAAALLDALDDETLDRLAERLAPRLAGRVAEAAADRDRWLDAREAGAYAGMHPDTLRKLAAAGRLPYEQERPSCKLYFRRADLDKLRAGGFHAASTIR